MVSDRYVIDTSSLIHLNRTNPIDIYETVWEKIGGLVQNGRLISSEEVFKELIKKDDSLSEWVKQNKIMFRPITKRQTEIVTKILQKYPSIINVKSEVQADPWVIALAVEQSDEGTQKRLAPLKWLVVTEEEKRGNRVKIPLICEDFKIDSLRIFEMFRQKGWKF